MERNTFLTHEEYGSIPRSAIRTNKTLINKNFKLLFQLSSSIGAILQGRIELVEFLSKHQFQRLSPYQEEFWEDLQGKP